MMESRSTKELIHDTLQRLLTEKEYTEVFHCLDRSHLLYCIMQVAFKTKFKDIDTEPDKLLADMPKERIYDFYFKIAGYWELTKRWRREENRSLPPPF